MAVAYETMTDSLVADKQRLRSEKRLVNMPGLLSIFDVAPGGKRLVAQLPVEAQQPTSHVIVLENFFDELKH